MAPASTPGSSGSPDDLISELSALEPLKEDFYAVCQEGFRSVTTQTQLMLDAVLDRLRAGGRLQILSVGSGAGLFEVPLLQILQESGISVNSFTGVDPSAYACRALSRRLRREFAGRFEYRVMHATFEEALLEPGFDLILWNHVMEYLEGSPRRWIERSISLRGGGGVVLIFSPNRGGINSLYEATHRRLHGRRPIFSDDLARALESASIVYSKDTLQGHCDVSSLGDSGEEADRVRLLSFLAQIDCRPLLAVERESLCHHYLSLRTGPERAVPHPTTLFEL